MAFGQFVLTWSLQTVQKKHFSSLSSSQPYFYSWWTHPYFIFLRHHRTVNFSDPYYYFFPRTTDIFAIHGLHRALFCFSPVDNFTYIIAHRFNVFMLHLLSIVCPCLLSLCTDGCCTLFWRAFWSLTSEDVVLWFWLMFWVVNLIFDVLRCFLSFRSKHKNFTFSTGLVRFCFEASVFIFPVVS